MQPERPKPLRLWMLFVAGVTCCWVQLVAAVARGEHVERLVGEAVAVAAERGVADVDVAEERARRGVVGPDLLLVGEQRRSSGWLAMTGLAPAPCCRRSPRAATSSVCDTAIASAPLNGAVPGTRRGQVRVVQARAVRPTRSRRCRRTAGPKATAGSPSETRPCVGVVGQRADRPGRRRRTAGRCRRRAPRQLRALQARVGRLRPGARRSRTRSRCPDTPTPSVNGQSLSAPGVAGLHVDVVVGARRPATFGCVGSMATAGSFCLFCENGLAGLPMLTRVSCAAAGPASATTSRAAANVQSAGRNSR